MRSFTALLLPASSVRLFRMTRVAFDSQSIVIPNHVREAEGRSGEGSPERKEGIKWYWCQCRQLWFLPWSKHRLAPPRDGGLCQASHYNAGISIDVEGLSGVVVFYKDFAPLALNLRYELCPGRRRNSGKSTRGCSFQHEYTAVFPAASPPTDAWPRRCSDGIPCIPRKCLFWSTPCSS